MSNVDPPTGGTKSNDGMYTAVKEFLESSKGIALVEQSIIGYAVERAVHDAIKNYLVHRVYPTLTFIVVVLGYFGYSLSDAKNSVETQLKIIEEQKKLVAANLETLQQNIVNARLKVDNLVQKAEITEELLQSRAGHQEKMLLHQSNYAIRLIEENQQKLQKEATSIKELDNIISENKEKLISLEQRSDQTEQKIQLGLKKATVLTDLAELHGRLIDAAVIEYVIMRSGTRSGMIELPRQKGAFKLQFEVPDIKDKFELVYRLDGRKHKLMISNSDKWIWYPIVGTDGLYEFRIDHVFHSEGKKVPDFLALRVRSTMRLAHEP
ncbi:hypothetical protein [Rheinheimera sp. F8]|uniref:hypothetical protein n=1 Tax=Rheinheimera sp. F8 TaxID=1763998 RepID=UPI00074483A9|nr:hypothetical protein [Rheinheimera sp. F8]ALZ76213.1 hypothetical protein ATY27_10880 [Rheinheimera sp. F8]ALZ77606.1 hypothetical protein ATY27_18775 [Rheinheimera sp. F8]